MSAQRIALAAGRNNLPTIGAKLIITIFWDCMGTQPRPMHAMLGVSIEISEV